MLQVYQMIRHGLTVTIGMLFYWLGGLDKLLIMLAAVLVLDYATGVISAWVNKTLSSELGFKGIAKKILLLGVVSLAFILEQSLGGNLPLREITIMFFIANEGLSILENAARCGLPLPKRLRDALQQLRGDSSDSKTDSSDK